MEAYKDQGSGRPTAKTTHDYDKVAQHCSDMARVLEKKAGSQFLAKPNISSEPLRQDLPYHSTVCHTPANSIYLMMAITSRHGACGGASTLTRGNDTASEASGTEKPSMRCRLVQVDWTKTKFERSKYTILEFAHQFMQTNRVRGLSVTRKGLVGYRNQLVWSFYG